jgi:hypothetical protein
MAAARTKMKIREFLADAKQIEHWLTQQKSSLSAEGAYMSYWLHSGRQGFGLVITDDRYSGEFHLMPDGTVTRHVEKDLDVLEDVTSQVTHFHELEARFEDFKAKIVHRAPSNEADAA